MEVGAATTDPWASRGFSSERVGGGGSGSGRGMRGSACSVHSDAADELADEVADGDSVEGDEAAAAAAAAAVGGGAGPTRAQKLLCTLLPLSLVVFSVVVGAVVDVGVFLKKVEQ